MFPYKKPPTAHRMAVLNEDGATCTTEENETVALDALPETHRVWGEYDLMMRLWGDKKGEALCWQNKPVRWRHRRYLNEDKWVPRHTDVRVLRLSFPEHEEALPGFARWRDFLAARGAAPLGSMGQSSWSLLRSTLRRPLWTNVGDKPPVEFVIGGRQELLQSGTFYDVRHYDLPAAYASMLGHMRYGGHWARVGVNYPYRIAAAKGVLCFVQAEVKVPDGIVGPLCARADDPERPGMTWSNAATRYPVGDTITGCWTFEEVDAASDNGCEVQLHDVWIHLSDDNLYPFEPWWDAIQEARQLPGFAGVLSKTMGNTLWGQFCVTPDAKREIKYWTGTRANPGTQRRPAPFSGQNINYSPDLAETLTGRVRAALYRCMRQVGAPLLFAHTDGLWTEGVVPSLPEIGWREKIKAHSIDVLMPQLYRYYQRKGGEATYAVAGAPDSLAPAIFEAAWSGMSETDFGRRYG